MRFVLPLVVVVLCAAAAYNDKEVAFVKDMTTKFKIPCNDPKNFCTGCGITCDKDSRAVSIDWSYNNITDITKSMSDFTALKELIIHDASMKKFPVNALTAPALEVIDFHSNAAGSFVIPTTITNLKKLRVLDLSGTGVSTVPVDLVKLTSLSILKLSRNAIKTLPADLKNSTSIKYIYLAANKFGDFPKALCDMPALEKIILNSNEIRTFPASCSLSKVTLLHLSGNYLTSFPEALENAKKLFDLDISDNYISSIPFTTDTWTHMDSITLYENKLNCHDIENAFRRTRIVTCLPDSQNKRDDPPNKPGSSPSIGFIIGAIFVLIVVVAAIIAIFVLVASHRHKGYETV